MNIRKKLLFILLGFSLLGGCSSGSDTVVEQNQQTYGQQLMDLKKAYDAGIITDREYKKSRDTIIDKMNN